MESLWFVSLTTHENECLFLWLLVIGGPLWNCWPVLFTISYEATFFLWICSSLCFLNTNLLPILCVTKIFSQVIVHLFHLLYGDVLFIFFGLFDCFCFVMGDVGWFYISRSFLQFRLYSDSRYGVIRRNWTQRGETSLKAIAKIQIMKAWK